jgi:hypothetical protein
MRAQPKPEDIARLIDRIEARTSGDTVTIGDVIAALGRRAFGPILVLASLIALLPTGAIPGMSFVTGAIMLLVCVQLLVGADRIWIPGVLARRGVDRRQLLSGLERLRHERKTLRRICRPRWEIMLRPPFVNLVAAAGIVLSLSNFLLGPLPFGSFPAGIAFIVIGLALTVRDGLLIAVGIALGVGSLALAWLFWPW